MKMSQRDISRFWSKIDLPAYIGGDECWLWQASLNKSGYGQFGIAGMVVRSHRLAYELCVGPIPDGLQVLHNCPNGDCPSCCNPDHLWLGNNVDNMNDKRIKNRAPRGQDHWTNRHPELRLRGERNGSSKLTREKVSRIRAKLSAGGVTQKELADEYGVTSGVIYCIVKGITWRDFD